MTVRSPFSTVSLVRQMTETKTEGNTIPSLQILYIHSDQDLISHVQSNEEVMKIKEMLTKGNYFAF